MSAEHWRLLGDFHLDTAELPEELLRYAREHRRPAILNLEGSFRGPSQVDKQFILSFAEDRLGDALAALDVRAVCLANNHATDNGPEGLSRMIDWLDARGVGHFGAGMTLEQSLRPWTTEIAGTTTHFVAFGWSGEACVPATRQGAGVAPLERQLVLDSVRELSRTGRVVVILHWGYEFETLPLPVDRRLAQELAKLGAWLVVGHHSHAIQSFETIGGMPVYYGLGNFFFGTRRGPMMKKYPHTATGLELVVEMESRHCEVRELDGMTLEDTGASPWRFELPPGSETEYLRRFKRERRVRNRPVLLPARPLRNRLLLAASRHGWSTYYKLERWAIQRLKALGFRRRR